MNSRVYHLNAAVWVLVVASVTPALLRGDEAAKARRLDPAQWGADHVGKPLPPYVTGDECLFCHRKIGPAWPANRHQLTIRPAFPEAPAIKSLRKLAGGNEFADQTRYLMGSRRITRFLKRSRDYGKFELLTLSLTTTSASEPQHREIGEDQQRLDQTETDKREALAVAHWDKTTFGRRCAGCHTTGVETRTQAFSAISLDCYACHGEVRLEHTKDVRQVLLSSQNQASRQVISICGQCHLRGGTSKSSGLPYANTFVAGDNLFRDFQVDFTDEAIGALPPVDKHVYLNARDVVVLDNTKVACLSCHDVHGQSSERHQGLPGSAICATCHASNTDHTELLDTFRQSVGRQAHSRVCDY